LKYGDANFAEHSDRARALLSPYIEELRQDIIVELGLTNMRDIFQESKSVNESKKL